MLFFIADNASTNKKVAHLSRKKMVGCLNHLLNLDIEDMIKRDTKQSEIVSKVHCTMKEARTLKNSSVLKKVTDVSATLPNET